MSKLFDKIWRVLVQELHFRIHQRHMVLSSIEINLRQQLQNRWLAALRHQSSGCTRRSYCSWTSTAPQTLSAQSPRRWSLYTLRPLSKSSSPTTPGDCSSLGAWIWSWWRCWWRGCWVTWQAHSSWAWLWFWLFGRYTHNIKTWGSHNDEWWGFNDASRTPIKKRWMDWFPSKNIINPEAKRFPHLTSLSVLHRKQSKVFPEREVYKSGSQLTFARERSGAD